MPRVPYKIKMLNYEQSFLYSSTGWFANSEQHILLRMAFAHVSGSQLWFLTPS